MSGSATQETVAVDTEAVLGACATLDAIGGVLSRIATDEWSDVIDVLYRSSSDLRVAGFGDAPDTDEACASDPVLLQLEILGEEMRGGFFSSLALHDEAGLCQDWVRIVSEAGSTDCHGKAPWHGTTPEAELLIDRDPEHTSEDRSWYLLGRALERLEGAATRLEKAVDARTPALA